MYQLRRWHVSNKHRCFELFGLFERNVQRFCVIIVWKQLPCRILPNARFKCVSSMCCIDVLVLFRRHGMHGLSSGKLLRHLRPLRIFDVLSRELLSDGLGN